jgi:quinol monooxygenase YgiN
MPMSRIMVVVEFEVKPEHRSQFIELIKGHAQRSRAEDGCQQLDMLLPQEDQDRVLLVGAWRYQAALDAHSNGPMVAKTQETVNRRAILPPERGYRRPILTPYHYR